MAGEEHSEKQSSHEHRLVVYLQCNTRAEYARCYNDQSKECVIRKIAMQLLPKRLRDTAPQKECKKMFGFSCGSVVQDCWGVLTGRRLRFLGCAFGVTFCGSIWQVKWGGWIPAMLAGASGQQVQWFRCLAMSSRFVPPEGGGYILTCLREGRRSTLTVPQGRQAHPSLPRPL